MAETLIKLIKNIQNDMRSNEKKTYNESSILDMKLSLLQNNLNKEFSKGVSYNNFLEILNNEIINCIFFDLVIYDYVILNIGLKTLKSLLINSNDIEFDGNTISIPIGILKQEILDIVSIFFYKEDTIILFEYSDEEARMVIKNKNNKLKSRSNIKFMKFPLYNFRLLDKK